MEQHISHLCHSAYLAVRQVASIHRYLMKKKTTVQLVCSFVLSRLDYCTTNLAGLPATHIARLQKIQNNAARPVLQKSKRHHVTTLLKQLHWLPIQTHIYKLTTLAFQHFDDSLPQYLSSRLDIHQPFRSLRSSNDRLLRVPHWKLKSFGYRFFSYKGSVVWNSLPTDLKFSSSLASFKSKLKTHLFKKNYSLCWDNCYRCYWSNRNVKKDVDAIQSDCSYHYCYCCCYHYYFNCCRYVFPVVIYWLIYPFL